MTLPGLALAVAADTPGAAADFCRLSNSLYARKVDPAYYHWQFFRTPFPTLLAVARSGEELVATYGMQVRPLASGDSFAWAVDIMVAPSWQRRGLFKALSAFALERTRAHGPVAVGVMANEKADRAHVEGLGWHRVQVFRTQEGPLGSAEAVPASWTFEECRDLTPHADWIEGLAAGRGLQRSRRTAALLQWRFLENPRYAYEVWLAGRAGVRFGYLVLKVFRDPTSGRAFGDVVDVAWREGDDDALPGLLHFARSRLAERGAATAAVWLQTNTALDRVGAALGFTPGPQSRYFCVKTLEPGHEEMARADRWFLTMADAEVY